MKNVSLKKGLSSLVMAVFVLAVVMIAAPLKARAAVPTMTANDFYVSSISSTTVTLKTVSHTAYTMEAIVYDVNGTPVATASAGKYSTYIYLNMATAKNAAYYVQCRLFDGTAYGGWSPVRAFAIPSLKVSLKSGGVRIKAGKLRGIKYVNVYMSKNRDSGYKKVAKLKSKKAKVLKKFRGKSFVRYQNYYYKLVAVMSNGMVSDTYHLDGFYIRRVWR